METLIINIPKQKSELVKRLLMELGVTVRGVVSTKRKPSDFLGSISKEKGEAMLRYVEKSREEWERNI